MVMMIMINEEEKWNEENEMNSNEIMTMKK